MNVIQVVAILILSRTLLLLSVRDREASGEEEREKEGRSCIWSNKPSRQRNAFIYIYIYFSSSFHVCELLAQRGTKVNAKVHCDCLLFWDRYLKKKKIYELNSKS